MHIKLTREWSANRPLSTPKGRKAQGLFKPQDVFLKYSVGPQFGLDRKTISPEVMAFFNAIYQGDLAAVKQALANGVDPNAVHNDDENGLFAVVRANAQDAVVLQDIAKALLEAGTDPNHQNRIGHTPLTCAMHFVLYKPERVLPLVNTLVQGGARLNQVNGMSKSPLLWLCERFQARPANGLLALKELIRLNAPINQVDRNNVTPLVHLVKDIRRMAKEDVPVFLAAVQALLDAGADINIRGKYDGEKNALDEAAKGYHPEGMNTAPVEWPELVRLLLARGGETLKPQSDKHPIVTAVREGFPQTFELLWPTIRPEEKQRVLLNALFEASYGESSPFIDRILAQNIDLNQTRSQHPATLLELMAMRCEKADLLSKLIAFGANPNLFFGQSKSTPLHWAANGREVMGEDNYDYRETLGYEAWPQGVEALLGYPALDLNPKNYQGNTPLMLAAKRCHIEVIRMLLGAGADATLKNDRGQTAYQIIQDLRDVKNAQAGLSFNDPRQPKLNDWGFSWDDLVQFDSVKEERWALAQQLLADSTPGPAGETA